ncbi:MAG TPA: 50S ribosomal protein L13 [Thermoplasmata archaeon]
MVVIDATGHIIGRLSSAVAKRLLNGEEVIVVNAEKALITGRRKWILEEFHHRRDIGSQRKGPFYPRRPDRILHRSVRGMVPNQEPRGRDAMKRLRVYVGVPAEFKDQPFERVAGADRITTTRYMTIGEIAERLGGSF